jgi:hypothetical protein
MVNKCWFKLAEMRGVMCLNLEHVAAGSEWMVLEIQLVGLEKSGNSSATTVAAEGLSQLVWNF